MFDTMKGDYTLRGDDDGGVHVECRVCLETFTARHAELLEESTADLAPGEPVGMRRIKAVNEKLDAEGHCWLLGPVETAAEALDVIAQHRTEKHADTLWRVMVRKYGDTEYRLCVSLEHAQHEARNVAEVEDAYAAAIIAPDGREIEVAGDGTVRA